MVDICGELRPKSKFLGNSAATLMEGSSHVTFLDRPEDEEYLITMPNMYARGILFGKVSSRSEADGTGDGTERGADPGCDGADDLGARRH